MAKPPTKNDVIKKYIYNDLERFLKRLYRYERYPLIYSVVLENYEREVKGIKKEILKHFKNEYPGNLCYIINVHRVMVQYYGFCIDMEDIILSARISQVMEIEFDKFKKAKTQVRYRELYLQPYKVKPKQALRELIARGFIHINDFEGYDKKMAHITTNANIRLSHGKLYYPKNFSWDAWSKNHVINEGHRWWDFTDVYLIIGSIGVSGFTRVLTPLDR